MARRLAVALLITCEHGGNAVPPRYRPVFQGHRTLLRTHRAYDLGAAILARDLGREFAVTPRIAAVTRLVVDLNRSGRHKRLFSELTRELPRDERRRILERWWKPYRGAVERDVARLAAGSRPVVHVAVHSFTPSLDGEVRTADVGLLYDPARPREKALCTAWRRALAAAGDELRVRFNYPYQGTADGLTTHLRRRFSDRRYAGIELEINQAWVGDPPRYRMLRRRLIEALRAALEG